MILASLLVALVYIWWAYWYCSDYSPDIRCPWRCGNRLSSMSGLFERCGECQNYVLFDHYEQRYNRVPTVVLK